MWSKEFVISIAFSLIVFGFIAIRNTVKIFELKLDLNDCEVSLKRLKDELNTIKRRSR